jgi:hypothetical protein
MISIAIIKKMRLTGIWKFIFICYIYILNVIYAKILLVVSFFIILTFPKINLIGQFCTYSDLYTGGGIAPQGGGAG